MNCGDICLIQFPFTDGSSAKVRPIVIISADRHNAGSDVVVLPISSSPGAVDAGTVVIDETSPHFTASGLNRTSAVKCMKPLTIAKLKLLRKLGVLDSEVLNEIRVQLADLFDITQS
jgi:mRNA interferase MazF